MTAAPVLDGEDGPQSIGRFDWERVVKRTRMPGSAKFLALTLATFGSSKDGTGVRPSVERLAREMEVTVRTVNRGMVWLRNNGWIVRTRPANNWKGTPAEYRLAVPPDVLDRLWLDPDGRPVGDMGVASNVDSETTPMSPRLLRDTHV
ncbi:helix-turn-helix domain-containing protein [Rhodococcoides fascians A25f]|uniref:helix-turn-helix domain-containing protein n=1 Tax=Rhodococcoides fascians TaxID=1828 RepID=UPI00056C94D1|nr:helix-turn-helix domain-containing protein [Rhodococcus fascians]QII05908.1 helix-turn-helix domain-containing protein [Rhodococcus fascians A25f]